MKKILFLTSVLLFLASCESIKYMQTTGGSKSDGVIEMSYEYGMFETPVVQWDDAKQKAFNACTAWGYKSAQPFGSGFSQCTAINGYGDCISWRVTYKYQCTD